MIPCTGANQALRSEAKLPNCSEQRYERREALVLIFFAIRCIGQRTGRCLQAPDMHRAVIHESAVSSKQSVSASQLELVPSGTTKPNTVMQHDAERIGCPSP